ncbi:MAG: hypothetical protein R2714_16205 [Microthrixaceae bacterium]
MLLSDGDEFDRDAYDFDIATQAVLAVLEAKPDSPVGLLTDACASSRPSCRTTVPSGRSPVT